MARDAAPAMGPAIGDVETYLARQEEKGQLRFLTCGSVDDGKSTLIGRLLYDSKLILDDQMRALARDSAKSGNDDGELDLSLVVDGLQAEREQGITIDVAYRFFATERRRFVVADTPGHEQYTRNMVTGASTADVAVILIDARKGVLPQTRRHSHIVALLGIRHVVLAVNKMDLVAYDQNVFVSIQSDYLSFAGELGLQDVRCIPVSALIGDNVFHASEAMAWYSGPTLLDILETIDVASDAAANPFRMPVQWVNRANADFRGFSGTILAGEVAQGDDVMVLPSAQRVRVERIVTMDGDLESAGAGQAVTLTFDREIDVSRGDVIAAATAPCGISDQFSAHLIWMHEDVLLPGRPYDFKLAAKSATAVIGDLKYSININTLEHQAAKTVGLNEICVCNLNLDQRIAFDPYSENRDMGGFILIDKISNHTVGAGMIDFALRRADNIFWQALDVDRAARAEMKGQRPCVVWFTGLSGSGKTTIANIIEKRLHVAGCHTYVLDGDNVRHGLNKDLGFTDADRVENLRRVGETAKLFTEAGLIVLVSFISPFRSERRMAREMMAAGEFIEIHVSTPIEVCEQRDPKGLYRKARAGEIKNFTGIDSVYESPENAELVLDTTRHDAEALAAQVVAHLKTSGFIDGV